MTKKEKEIYNNLAFDKQDRFIISKESVDKMNKGLISRWNERVKPEDTIFHIGDFCFKNSQNRGEGINVKASSWKDRLNGNIIFIKGNHDRNNTVKTRIHSLVLNLDNHYVNLVHDPLRADVNFETNITGHVHNAWEIKRIRRGNSFTDCINVGVDVWNYYPVTFDQIKARYSKWLKNAS